MKKYNFYKILLFLNAVMYIFTACTKDTSQVQLPSQLSTSQYLNLKSDSVIVVGFIVATGSGFTERGVCYNTSPAPTITNSKVVYNGSTSTATFKVKLKISRLTKYYVRAYATGESGTVYGDEYSFTTPAAIPTIANIVTSTLAITPDQGVTATTPINISDDGGPSPTANITKRGVVFGLVTHPVIDSTSSKLSINKTYTTSEGTGKGEYSSLASNLKGKTKYYLRAYATNSIGTAYSNEVSFTTGLGFATITTNTATNVAKTSSTLNGKYNYSGGGTVSERGFSYGLTANPTILVDTKVAVAGSDSTILADISGLTANTTYHYRAYVINEAGTNYGTDVTFTTMADIIKLWIVGDATAHGWNNDDGAPFILSTATSNGDAEGYLYLTIGGFKLTTDHSWDNAHTFGFKSAGVLTNPGDNIAITVAGYYKIQANTSKMTYAVTATNWGLIGDATPGGWNDETALTYNSTSSTWIGEMHLTAPTGGAAKFRANHSWDYNYGSDKADGTLTAGGGNIPITIEDDYAITLDLSHPNVYTYRIDRWGVIGDATADGWNSDQNMVWDAVNKVFKATLALTKGSIKFRANDAWTYALGGTLDVLSSSGDNISVDTPGNYLITLDPWALKATLTAAKK